MGVRAQVPLVVGCRPVAEQLMAEFAGVLPVEVVEAAVRSAEQELRGQVPKDSLEELVHRLAGYRLRERLESAER
jgi:hypothetical protein